MKRLIVLSLLFVAVGLLFFANSHALAAKAHEGCQLRFMSYDTNGDGVITREEYHMGYNTSSTMGTGVGRPAPSFVQFNALDHGGKGYLTERDFCARMR